MVYEFKSKATGTVVMVGPVAERMLAIIGKAPSPRGIVTVEQLGPAIDALQQAVAAERSRDANGPGGPGVQAGQGVPRTDGTDANRDDGQDDRDPHQSVSLAQRAFPLIEMFTAARAAGKDVTWGV